MSIKRETDLRDLIRDNRREVLVEDLRRQVKTGFTFEDEKLKKIREKIEASGKPLGKLFDIKRGPMTCANDAFIVGKELGEKFSSRYPEIVKKCIRGRDFKKYTINWGENYIIFFPSGYTDKVRGNINPEEYIKTTYNMLYEYIYNQGKMIESGEIKSKSDRFFNRAVKGKYWWELGNQRNESVFIGWSRISKEFIVSFVEGYEPIDSVCYMNVDNEDDIGIIGILNSDIGESIYRKLVEVNTLEDRGSQRTSTSMANFIIPEEYRKLNGTVKNIVEVKSNREVEKIVQQLYGLTDEEVAYLCK